MDWGKREPNVNMNDLWQFVLILLINWEDVFSLQTLVFIGLCWTVV